MKHHVLASAAFFAAALSGLTLDRAHAAQVKDDDNGFYVDDFSDSVGVSSFSITAVNVTTGVVELTTGQPGFFITKDINPTALSSWNKVYLKGAAGFELYVLRPDGTVLQTAALVGSDDPNFSQMALLNVAPSEKPIRLKVGIAPNGPIAPSLDKLKVTWSPQATLLLTAQSPGTICSGTTGLFRFPFSVSNVTARSVVIKVPLTTGQLPQAFADQNPNLQFVGATQGGLYHAGPGSIVVDGVTIDPNTVYWRLGDVRYGSTFPLSFTAVIPNGTLKNTIWNFTASATATNAQPVQTAVPTLTAEASPGLVLEKSLTGVYRIGNEWRARNGSTIGYRITARHSYSPTCRATIENAVIWDPLTITTTPNGQSPYAGGPTLVTPGLFYTAGGATPYPANGFTTPITVPANSVYAKIDSLPVGASMTWEFTLPLSGALNDNELVTNKVFANITYTPQRQVNNLEAQASFRIGIDYLPRGLYAKGDSIRGSASISAGQDNLNLKVGYGEYLKFLLYAGNQGASVLKNTTLFDKIPVDKVDFVDAYAPPGVTLYYYSGGASNAANNPPGYDAATGALTGWTTQPGATVNWVAAKIDRIGSSVITDNNGTAPLSTTVEIGVRVKPPTNGCADDSITNDGAFHTVSYENALGAVVPTNMAIATNAESVEVVPQVPSFALSWASSNPAIAIASGPIDYTVNVTNLVPNAPGQTDLAQNVRVRIDVPRTSIGGVTRAIDVIGVDTQGGVVDTSDLPDFLTVTYPQLGAGASAVIVVHTSVPRGVVDGGQARLSASITGQDAGEYTCPVPQTTVSATTTFRVDPVLRVDKRVDFEVAGRDKDLTYTLRSVNTGDGAALGPVVVDKLPADLVFVSAAIPGNGQRIWFSAADVPVLPPDVRDTFTWSSSFITSSGHFVQGVVSNGRIVSPIANPKWIAVLVDDATLNPAQLPADGLAREVSFKMHVPATMQLDRVILNEANISAVGLPRAVSNRPQTLISDDPAIRITGECIEAIAALENRHFVQTFTNTSTNDDTLAIARMTVPLGDVTPIALTVTSPAGTFSIPLSGNNGHQVSFNTVNNTLTISWNITADLGRPFAAGEAATMDLEVEAKSTVLTGQAIAFTAQGEAQNGAGSVSVGAQCQTLVANPDLRIFKLVDRDRVVEGDNVTYTLVIDNVGAHDVANVVIRELLPAGLSFASGTVRVSPSSWTLQSLDPVVTGATDPLNGGQVLEWSLAQGNALIGPTTPAGTLPANSTRIYLSFRTNVTATTPGDEINNCAKVAIGVANGDQLGDEHPGDNQHCVPVRLPYPDPKIAKTGPADVLPGASFAYTLTWANGSRQLAEEVVFFERVPNFDFSADSNPDLTVSSVVAPSGVEVFYASAGYASADPADHPAFAFANPLASGTWKASIADLGGAPATWIAFKVGTLPGLAAPRSASVQVSAVDPDTQEPVAAGQPIYNCASIAMKAGVQDEADGNNVSCITTRVPGLNVAIAKTCDPAGYYPGARPGDTVRFVIDIRNVGYSAAYGLRVTDVLPTWFELAGLESNTATATESGGAETTFIDAGGQPVTGGITWTRQDDDWTLGTTAAGDTRYYRKLGLRPDTKTQLVVFGRVALDTPAQFLASNTATVATDRRNDQEEAETILLDNTGTCSFTVHRPDPAIEKFVDLPTTANGSASPGDILTWGIGYDNLGLARSEDVTFEDLLPAGVTFILGSVTDVPDGATLEYFDGSNWNYQPTGADGTPDPNVKGIRVSFGSFPAPLAGNFTQNSQGSFARGTYAGTHWDADLGAVVVDADTNLTVPTYTSPLIPTDGAQVLEWISLLSTTIAGATRPEIDLLDANGDVIGTIYPGDADSVALADFVDPTVNELVQLRARFQPPTGGRYDPALQFLEPIGEAAPQDGEVWLLAGDLAAGRVAPSSGGGYGDGYSGLADASTRTALWARSNGTWQLVPIEEPSGAHPEQVVFLDANLLVVSGQIDSENAVWGWRLVGDTWTYHRFGPSEPGSSVGLNGVRALEGPNAALCAGAPCHYVVFNVYDYSTSSSANYAEWPTPTGWEGTALAEPNPDEYCNLADINQAGFIFAECNYTFAMWTPTGAGWALNVIDKVADSSTYPLLLSHVNGDFFGKQYNGQGPGVVRFRDNRDGTWTKEVLADFTSNISGGGPGGHFFGTTTVNSIPVLWKNTGTASAPTYTQITLSAPNAARPTDVNADGLVVGTRNGGTIVWQPTGPTTYDYSLLAGLVYDNAHFGADDFAFAGYMGLVAAGPTPRIYSANLLTSPGSDTTRARDAGASGFVGEAIGGTAGAGPRPMFWPTEATDTETSTIEGVLLETPPGPILGGIIDRTEDGCVLGFTGTIADGALVQWVDDGSGNLTPNLLDASGPYQGLTYVASSPNHRHFANAYVGDLQIAVELQCSDGIWVAEELPRGPYNSTTVSAFARNYQFLHGRADGSETVYWDVMSAGTPRLVVREYDGAVGEDFEFISKAGQLFGYIRAPYVNGNTVYHAAVWTPTPTGNDDFTLTLLPEGPDGTASFANDYDGAGRITGYVVVGDMSKIAVWTRVGDTWELTQTGDATMGEMFVGTGPNAAILARVGYYDSTMFEVQGNALVDVGLEGSGQSFETPWDYYPRARSLARAIETGYLWGKANYSLTFWYRDANTWKTTRPADAPVNYSDAIAMVAPGVFLVRESNPVDWYDDYAIYRLQPDGSMTRTVLSYGSLRGTYTYNDRWSDVGDDGTMVLWYATNPDASYPAALVAVGLVPDGTEASGYRLVGLGVPGQVADFAAATRTANGCWSLPATYSADPDDDPFPNGVASDGSSPFRLWGCPTKGGSTGPTEALASWNVIYRSDAKPRIGFETRVDRVCQLEIANTATISTSSVQLTTVNDTATARVNVATADLAVTLTTPTTIIGQGEPNVTATLTVTNRGPMDAKDVVLNLTLPSGVSLGAGGQTQFTIASIGPNATVPFQVPLVVTDLNADVTHRLTANATSGSLDCNPDNDGVTLSLLVGTWPDIRVTKTGPATVRAFEPFAWQVGWQNLGNDATQPFVVNDDLPLDANGQVAVELLSIGNADDLDTVLQWPAEELAIGGSNNDEIQAIVTDCSLIGTTLVNHIGADYQDDANPNDNDATATTLVEAPLAAAELTITGPDLANSVDLVHLDLTATSIGSAAAEGGVLTVTIQGGTLIDHSDGTVSPDGTLTFTLPRLRPSDAGALTLDVQATGPLTITASIDGSNFCPTSVAKNIDFEPPECTTDLDCDDGFDCTVDSCDPLMGCTSTANDAACDDGFSCTTNTCDPVSPDHDFRGCVSQSDDLACDDLDACTTDYCAGSTAGTIDGCVHDEIPGCRVTTTNVVITKTPALSNVDVRGVATWTLTATNLGTLVATNVVISDGLPDGLAFQSSSVAPTSSSGQYFYWNIGALQPGGSVSITVTALAGCEVFGATASASVLVTNTAYVTADNDPDDLDWDTDGDTDMADLTVTRNMGGDLCDGIDDDCDGIDGNDGGCDDGNECTDDVCMNGTCQHPGNANSCDDGDNCTTGDICQNTQCQGSTVNCDDGLDCTNDYCDPASGQCMHTPDDTVCTEGGQCRTGTCDPTMGCVYTPEPERCDDGNDCTDDVCDEATGACMNAEVVCDDNNFCTTDSCDPSFGCKFELISCDDDNACTTDTCDETVGCMNQVLDCDDSDKCTTDACNPATGCEYEPISCNDDDACTTDSCDADQGCQYAPVTCSGDACNTGSCDRELGCTLTPIDCDDGSACTNDVCNPILGCLYTQVQCTDDDLCTTDQCDPESGCFFTNTDCDDNNACTNDSCDSKLGCQHEAISCDDNNACTNDFCDPVQGCRNTLISCDDNDFCTNDSCNPETGCEYEQVPPVEVECGTGACGGVTQGLSQCIDNAWVDNCEEVPTGAIPDTGCSPKRVAYAIVNDENGEPYGTIRCFQDLTTFAVACETVPGTSELKVYDAFFCGLNDEVTK